MTPPDVLTGIDGEVVNEFPPRGPEPIKVTIFPTPKPPPLKCKKGFHRKRVKGKLRCVRKHKHRRHGGSKRGGRSAAAAR